MDKGVKKVAQFRGKVKMYKRDAVAGEIEHLLAEGLIELTRDPITGVVIYRPTPIGVALFRVHEDAQAAGVYN